MEKFFIFLLFSTTVYGLGFISEPHMRRRALNFAEPIEGRKLNGSVIKDVDVSSEISCQFECLGEDHCHSYNFGPSKTNPENFACQLSDSDRFVGLANFIEDADFKYGGLQSACEEDRSPCGDKGVCIPIYKKNSVRCNCDDGYIGIPCKPKSCAQLRQDGFTSDGVYTINPDGGKPLKVLCDMTTDGGGWTVFQRRFDGSVDFFLVWEYYKNGFGDLSGEFWLGNDNLHRLTTAYDVKFRVDLEDFENTTAYAEYTTFKVADEGDNYRLLIGEYNGTAGDPLASGSQAANNMQFSTQDQDHDAGSGNCAIAYKGAWWYRYCHGSNLNGLYLGGPHDSFADGMEWHPLRGHHYSFKRTEMKIKPQM